MAATNTYSFLDVQATITGPGGTLSLGDGGVAEEGITVTMGEDKNTMLVGADGVGMHSLHAAKSGQVTLRLLKTSPVNRQLNTMYNFQQTTSANWGQNTLTVTNPVRGDSANCRQGAFKKQPDFVNAKDGNVVEWAFDFILIDQILGDGTFVGQ